MSDKPSYRGPQLVFICVGLSGTLLLNEHLDHSFMQHVAYMMVLIGNLMAGYFWGKQP